MSEYTLNKCTLLPYTHANSQLPPPPQPFLLAGTRDSRLFPCTLWPTHLEVDVGSPRLGNPRRCLVAYPLQDVVTVACSDKLMPRANSYETL